MNVIHSGLAKKLEEEYILSIMSDLITHRDIEHLNGHFQTSMQLLPVTIPKVSRPVQWLRISQKFLFYHLFKIETLDIKIMQRSGVLRQIIRTTAESPAMQCLSKLLLILIRKILIRLITRRQRYLSLSRYRFVGVVSTSPLDIRENEIANSLKIKKAAIVISWDNLTSKGLMNADHDLIIVWNRFMADEYRRFHSIFGVSGQIEITGIPRFDLYFREKSLHEALCEIQPQLPIRSEEKVILFATSATRHITCQRYILEHLVEYSETKPDVVIWVRCHPGDDLASYQHFADIPHIRLISPFRDSLFNARIPPLDFLHTLHAQLRVCHVCVQVASTVRLDAAACDKPVVSIAYDECETRYLRSVGRLYDYTHQIPLNRLGIDHRIHSKQELFEKLDEILNTPSGKLNYKSAIIPLIHHSKPISTELTKKYIYKWLR